MSIPPTVEEELSSNRTGLSMAVTAQIRCKLTTEQRCWKSCGAPVKEVRCMRAKVKFKCKFLWTQRLLCAYVCEETCLGILSTQLHILNNGKRLTLGNSLQQAMQQLRYEGASAVRCSQWSLTSADSKRNHKVASHLPFYKCVSAYAVCLRLSICNHLCALWFLTFSCQMTLTVLRIYGI